METYQAKTDYEIKEDREWWVHSKASNTRTFAGRLIYYIGEFYQQINIRAAQISGDELTNFKTWVDEAQLHLRQEMSEVLTDSKQTPETVFANYDRTSKKIDSLITKYIADSDSLTTSQKEDKLREIYQLGKQLHQCVRDACSSSWAQWLYRDQDWFVDCQRDTPHLFPVPAPTWSQFEPPVPLQDMSDAGTALPQGYENFVLPKVAPIIIRLDESDTDTESDSSSVRSEHGQRVSEKCQPPKKEPIVVPVSSATLQSSSQA